jgi:hypothetical protein
MLMRVELPPGIFSDNTTYSAGARWVDGDGVRFQDNYPEKLGGNILYHTHLDLTDNVHGLIIWSTLVGTTYTGYGCEQTYIVASATQFYDTTPVAYSFEPTTITTVATIATIALTYDPAHLPVVGDFLYLTGWGDPGIDGWREISAVNTGTGMATLIVVTPAGSTGSISGAGKTIGGRVSFAAVAYLPSTGFGSGGFGSGGFGGTGATAPSADNLYLWSHDNFGELLVYNARGGPIYIWQPDFPNNLALSLEAFSAPAIDLPTTASFILVAETSRQLIVLGTNDTGSDVFDPMLVRWSDVEALDVWTPALTNQTGSLRLTDGSKIIAGVRTRQAVIIFTDTAMYALQYIGAPEVYGQKLLATNVNVIAPNAIVADDDVVYWMAADGFYRFDGAVQKIPCPLTRHVFDNLTTGVKRQTAIAGVNKAFQEIWFSYPTDSETMPNRTVIYNTRTNAWTPLSTGRHAWVTGGLVGGPVSAVGPVKVQQEQGHVDYLSGIAAELPSFIVSGAIEMQSEAEGSGNRFLLATKLIPDVYLPGNSNTVTFDLAMYHDASEPSYQGATPTALVTVVASVQTPQIDIRARGRAYTVQVTGAAGDFFWKLGVPRIAIRPDGRR